MVRILNPLPESVSQTIRRLERGDRFVNDGDVAIINCTEVSATKRGEPAYQLCLLVGENKWFGGSRKTVESQLVEARVCKPCLVTRQELKWRELKSILRSFFPAKELDEALWLECRNSHLRSLVDSLENDLPLHTYLMCKQIIIDLGQDRFESDFEWYFNTTVQEEYWRGLEN